jgi:predicted RNA-binding Zn-ribbon protein involved in translation (DUF1610 family)
MGGLFLIILGALLFYVILPVLAARFAYQRGHDGWAILTIISIFIGLAPVIGLFAWLASIGSPLEADLIDHYQRQCPNCGGYKVSGRRSSPKSRTYSYSCTLCGYQWSWQLGTPWPSVTVRPDLIAKGEQRLEKEAAIRQQQEQAALYYLSQQGKK